MKRWTAAAVGCACVVSVWAAPFWDRIHYSEWTRQQALRVLVDSPWSHTFRPPVVMAPVSGGLAPRGTAVSYDTQPVPATAASEEQAYVALFYSALPVRMALAQLAVLEGRLLPTTREAWVRDRPFQGDVAIMLLPHWRLSGRRSQGTDSRDWALRNLTLEALQEVTHLRLEGSRRELPLKGYMPPAGGNGALFLFPREDGSGQQIGPADKKIRFVTRGAELKLEARFNLKKMQFEEKLEL